MLRSCISEGGGQNNCEDELTADDDDDVLDDRKLVGGESGLNGLLASTDDGLLATAASVELVTSNL